MTASNYEFHDCSSLRLSSAGKQTRRELLSLDSTRRTRSKCKTAPPTTPAPCFIRHKALLVRLTTRQPHYSVRNDATYTYCWRYIQHALAVLGIWLCWYGNGQRLLLSSSVRTQVLKSREKKQRMSISLMTITPGPSTSHCADAMLIRYRIKLCHGSCGQMWCGHWVVVVRFLTLPYQRLRLALKTH